MPVKLPASILAAIREFMRKIYLEQPYRPASKMRSKFSTAPSIFVFPKDSGEHSVFASVAGGDRKLFHHSPSNSGLRPSAAMRSKATATNGADFSIA